MRKNDVSLYLYLYKGRTFMSVPDNMYVKSVKVIDGKKYGVLKKKSTNFEFVLLILITLMVYALYDLPTGKDIVQIPETFYATGNLLNVDINNTESNEYTVYITIKSTSGEVLLERTLPPGTSIGAVEINTNLPTYILEYKIKWKGIYDIKRTFKIMNSNYKEVVE